MATGGAEGGNNQRGEGKGRSIVRIARVLRTARGRGAGWGPAEASGPPGGGGNTGESEWPVSDPCELDRPAVVEPAADAVGGAGGQAPNGPQPEGYAQRRAQGRHGGLEHRLGDVGRQARRRPLGGAAGRDQLAKRGENAGRATCVRYIRTIVGSPSRAPSRTLSRIIRSTIWSNTSAASSNARSHCRPSTYWPRPTPARRHASATDSDAAAASSQGTIQGSLYCSADGHRNGTCGHRASADGDGPRTGAAPGSVGRGSTGRRRLGAAVAVAAATGGTACATGFASATGFGAPARRRAAS